MQTPNIIIVNEHDEIIGYTPRDEHAASQIYRVSNLWVTNARGDILLAQRKLTKKYSPGQWGPAVGGTHEQGETYYTNIVKETAEEIGVVGITPKEGPKLLFRHDRQYFCQWYSVELDWPIDHFTPQVEEVEQLRWVSPIELEAEVKAHPENFTYGIKWACANF